MDESGVGLDRSRSGACLPDRGRALQENKKEGTRIISCVPV